MNMHWPYQLIIPIVTRHNSTFKSQEQCVMHLKLCGATLSVKSPIVVTTR